MSDDNSPAAVAAQHDPNNAIVQENATLRARLAALEKQNVVEGRFTGEVPRYQLNDRGFYDDTLFEPGSIIDYLDPPNLTMVPLNEAARKRIEAEMERQIEGARDVAERNGRRFTGLVNDRNVLIDDARADAKAAAAASVPSIKMPTIHATPPQMPHTAEAQAAERRGPGRPRKAMAVQQPASGPRDLGAPMLAPVPGDPHGLGPAVVGRRVA